MCSRIVLVALLLALSQARQVSAADKLPDTPAGKLVGSPRTLVIGHRGNAMHFPENTLVSFNSAVKLGADVVELDYMVTSDGQQVCFHDKDLDRTTNAFKVLGRTNLTIGDVTFDEVRRLDAGFWFDDQFKGAKVPTLAEALDLIQKGSVTMIERKTGPADACVELLKEKGLTAKVVVQAFDWNYIADMHKLDPKIVVGALGNEELTAEKLDQIEASGAMLVGWRESDLTKADIEAVHARGLKIWTYTVNKPARARQLIADGIDGLISDDPATILKLIK
jgi:glycerophosphoryl diester phosphodiesterase